MTLEELRDTHGFSIEDIALALRVSRMTVYMWEQGKATPNTKNLRKLANLFDTTMDEMMSIIQETQKQRRD